MQCGLFGKLPSKRDFVSYNMTRPFLESWERWLQAGLAESKLLLDDRWQELFLTMPIWRFWLGPNVFGQSVTGALMPSVDGVGRYFPLSLCAQEPEGARLLQPASEGLDQWYDAGETLLLRMLEDGFAEDVPTLLRDFSFPPVAPAASHSAQPENVTNWMNGQRSLEAAFADIETRDQAKVNAERSYWWTLGGSNHAQQLVTTEGPLDSGFFAALMTATFN